MSTLAATRLVWGAMLMRSLLALSPSGAGERAWALPGAAAHRRPC
jgi:hypothetical protein